MTTVIWLTDKHGKPNQFGIGYISWFYSLRGPTFMVIRRRSD